MVVTLQQVALFLAGGLAWDVVLHLAMIASKTEIKMFGIKFTHKVNQLLAITNTIIVLLLLWYALI